MSELPTHAGADEVQAHPHATGHRRFDIVMAVCAIFISAVSLVVAVEHGRTERDLVAANSWPFLRAIVTNNFGDDRKIAIGLSNGGVGPAKVKSFEMFLDRRPIDSPYDLLRRCCGLPTESAAIKRAIPDGLERSMVDQTVLRPGEDNEVLIVPRPPGATEIPARLTSVLTRLTFRACYCSVLDQCWTSDLMSTDTPSVPACKPPEHPYKYNGD